MNNINLNQKRCPFSVKVNNQILEKPNEKCRLYVLKYGNVAQFFIPHFIPSL